MYLSCYIFSQMQMEQLRPYTPEHTASRPICEVKLVTGDHTGIPGAVVFATQQQLALAFLSCIGADKRLDDYYFVEVDFLLFAASSGNDVTLAGCL